MHGSEPLGVSSRVSRLRVPSGDPWRPFARSGIMLGLFWWLSKSKAALFDVEGSVWRSYYVPRLYESKVVLSIWTSVALAFCCITNLHRCFRPFLSRTGSPIFCTASALMPRPWLFCFHLNTFPFNAFFFTLIHLFSPGSLKHGPLELPVLIVVGNLMPRDSLLRSPLLSSLSRNPPRGSFKWKHITMNHTAGSSVIDCIAYHLLVTVWR